MVDGVHADQRADGRSIREFNVIDDFNSEALCPELGLSLTPQRAIRTRKQIIGWRGKPAAIGRTTARYLSAAIVDGVLAYRVSSSNTSCPEALTEGLRGAVRRTVRRVAAVAPIPSSTGTPRTTFSAPDSIDVVLPYERPNMATGGFHPKQRLAMAA
jgi:putative transposase